MCTNCVLLPHYKVISLCNCKLGMSPECHCPLIIQALDNCQNFNLGQANFNTSDDTNANYSRRKWWILKLGLIKFSTPFFFSYFNSSQFWHLFWHPMWHTFTKAFVRKCKCAKKKFWWKLLWNWKYLLPNLIIVKMVKTFVGQFI